MWQKAVQSTNCTYTTLFYLENNLLFCLVKTNNAMITTRRKFSLKIQLLNPKQPIQSSTSPPIIQNKVTAIFSNLKSVVIIICANFQLLLTCYYPKMRKLITGLQSKINNFNNFNLKLNYLTICIKCSDNKLNCTITTLFYTENNSFFCLVKTSNVRSKPCPLLYFNQSILPIANPPILHGKFTATFSHLELPVIFECADHQQVLIFYYQKLQKLITGLQTKIQNFNNFILKLNINGDDNKHHFLHQIIATKLANPWGKNTQFINQNIKIKILHFSSRKCNKQILNDFRLRVNYPNNDNEKIEKKHQSRNKKYVWILVKFVKKYTPFKINNGIMQILVAFALFCNVRNCLELWRNSKQGLEDPCTKQLKEYVNIKINKNVLYIIQTFAERNVWVIPNVLTSKQTKEARLAKELYILLPDEALSSRHQKKIFFSCCSELPEWSLVPAASKFDEIVTGGNTQRKTLLEQLEDQIIPILNLYKIVTQWTKATDQEASPPSSSKSQ